MPFRARDGRVAQVIQGNSKATKRTRRDFAYISDSSTQSSNADHTMESETRNLFQGKLMQEISHRRVSAPDLVEASFGHIISLQLTRDIVIKLLRCGLLQVFQKEGSDEPSLTTSSLEQAADFAVTCAQGARDFNDSTNRDTYFWKWTGQRMEGELEAAGFLNAVSMASYVAAHCPADSDAPFGGRKPLRRFSRNPYRDQPLPLSESKDVFDACPDFLLLPITAWVNQEDEYSTYIADFPVYQKVLGMQKDLSPPEFAQDRNDLDEHLAIQKVVEDINQDDLPSSECHSSQPPPLGLKRIISTSEDQPRMIWEVMPNSAHYRYLNLQYVHWLFNEIGGECKHSKLPTAITQTHWYMRTLRRCQPWRRWCFGLSTTSHCMAFLRGDSSGVEECLLDFDSSRGVIDSIRVLLGLILSTDEEMGADKHFTFKEDVVDVSKWKGNKRVDVHEGVDKDEPGLKRTKFESSSAVSKSKDPEFPQQFVTNALKQYIHGETVCDIHFLVFQAGSLCGRGTCVWRVSYPESPETYYALKLSWLDCVRAERVLKTYEALRSGGVRKFLVPEISPWYDRDDSSLTARGYLTDEGLSPDILREKRYCVGTLTPFKRVISQYKSLDEFVELLIDVIDCISELEQNKLLHRDISLGNLAFADGDKNDCVGLLSDMDLITTIPPQLSRPDIANSQKEIDLPVRINGTNPFIAIDLLGSRISGYIHHTVHHDLESVFYCLYLFFFTYDGPSDSVYPEKPTPKRCPWPDEIRDWALDGDRPTLAAKKHLFFRSYQHLIDLDKLTLARSWVDDSDTYLAIQRLIGVAWTVFWGVIQTDEGHVANIPVQMIATPERFKSALTYWLDWRKGIVNEFNINGWK